MQTITPRGPDLSIKEDDGKDSGVSNLYKEVSITPQFNIEERSLSRNVLN